MSNETLMRTGLIVRNPKTPPSSPEIQELFNSVDLVTARKMKHFLLNNTGDCIFLDSALGLVLSEVLDRSSTIHQRYARAVIPYSAVTNISYAVREGVVSLAISTAHSTTRVNVSSEARNEHSEKLLAYMYQCICYRINGEYLRDVKPELFVIPGPPAAAPQKTEVENEDAD